VFAGVDHVSYTECWGYGRIAANDTALFFCLPELIFPLSGKGKVREFVLNAFHEAGLMNVEALMNWSWTGRRGMG
jgi:hypothetical protein